jgi:hypothetical protein
MAHWVRAPALPARSHDKRAPPGAIRAGGPEDEVVKHRGARAMALTRSEVKRRRRAQGGTRKPGTQRCGPLPNPASGGCAMRNRKAAQARGFRFSGIAYEKQFH